MLLDIYICLNDLNFSLFQTNVVYLFIYLLIYLFIINIFIYLLEKCDKTGHTNLCYVPSCDNSLILIGLLRHDILQDRIQPVCSFIVCLFVYLFIYLLFLLWHLFNLSFKFYYYNRFFFFFFF